MYIQKSSIQISVIMPVHDTGECLKETLDSVFSQTLQNFELICVDDYSQDVLTIDFLKKYDEVHKNMRLIRSDRKIGAAEARNTGLREAKGKYVIFLDSDDLFSEMLLENLWDAAEKRGADLVLCNTSELKEDMTGRKDIPEWIPEDVFNMSNLGDSGLVDCGLVPWNKLVLRSLLIKNEIGFQSLPSCNDVSFSCLTLFKAKKIFYPQTEALVFWRGSRAGQINSHRNPVNLYYAVMDVFNKCTYSEHEINKIVYILMRQGIPELRQSANIENSRDFYEKTVDFLKQDREFNFEDESDLTLLELYTEMPYESYWWETINIYYAQIYINHKKILAELPKMDKVILWGCGVRGSAFLKVALEVGWKLNGCYDRNEIRAEEVSQKYRLIKITEEGFIDENTAIVASTSTIYEYLVDKYPLMRIFNLEKYCFDY